MSPSTPSLPSEGSPSSPPGEPAVQTAPSASPPVPLRNRRWFVPVVAIVVATVVIVAVLAVAASLAPKPAGTTTETYSTFSESESVAGIAASHAESGTWSAELAAGVRIGSSLALPLANLTSLSNLTSNCSLSVLPGLPSDLTVDATPTSTPAGHAAFWLFGFSDGSGTLLLVSVDLGIPTALFSLTAGTCLGSSVSLDDFPSTEVDSPALVAAANASGGAAFLDDHPGAAQIFAGVGGVSYSVITSSPLWEVADTSCPLPYPINETGAAFNATVSGTGSVLTNSSGPVNCAAGLGSSLSGVALLDSPLERLAQAI
jgi:hypothetical protein